MYSSTTGKADRGGDSSLVGLRPGWRVGGGGRGGGDGGGGGVPGGGGVGCQHAVAWQLARRRARECQVSDIRWLVGGLPVSQCQPGLRQPVQHSIVLMCLTFC
jgi:hypothetical protein